MEKRFKRYDKRQKETVLYAAQYNGGEMVHLFNETTKKEIPLESRTARKLKAQHPTFEEVTK